MHLDNDQWRSVFEDATASFVHVVDGIAADRWELPALGEWSLLDLVGHTSRALLTIELYLARDAGPITLDSPVAYLARVAQAGASDEARRAIAERGRDAGAALGTEPASAIAAIAERVVALVDRTADDAPCTTPFGEMTLASYLPTRAFELTVHTLDIVRSLDGPAPAQLAEPIVACLDLAAEAIGETGGAADVLLALAGRQPLPGDLRIV